MNLAQVLLSHSLNSILTVVFSLSIRAGLMGCLFYSTCPILENHSSLRRQKAGGLRSWRKRFNKDSQYFSCVVVFIGIY